MLVVLRLFSLSSAYAHSATWLARSSFAILGSESVFDCTQSHRLQLQSQSRWWNDQYSMAMEDTNKPTTRIESGSVIKVDLHTHDKVLYSNHEPSRGAPTPPWFPNWTWSNTTSLDRKMYSRMGRPMMTYVDGPRLARYRRMQFSNAATDSLALSPTVDTTKEPPSSAYDTTGQIALPGAVPRVTAIPWNDDDTICCQVEARQIYVARQEYSDIIIGTGLLEAAGLKQGKMDAIWKGKKMRRAVQVGPPHLKVVWIPFQRALAKGNEKRIMGLLYPLFIPDIQLFLCHPVDQNRAMRYTSSSK